MILMRTIIASLIGFTLNSCGNLDPARARNIGTQEDDIQRNSTALAFYTEQETGLAYSGSETSPSAWIFLVAGSLRGANFAQEIIEQRQLWLNRGAHPDEIACYFVIPDKIHFDKDAEQYRAIAPELRACKLASFKLIAADLARSAVEGKRDLYLYITSHGDQPLSYYADSTDNEDERAKYNWLVKKYPFLDRYMMALDATPLGTANTDGQLDAVDQGTPADEIFLTPQNFHSALKQFGPATRKTVVLQGCFTGGFIKDERSVSQPHLLSTLHNITVITASRNDRPSFGCDIGGEKTFFGGALIESLAESEKLLPDAVNWEKVFQATRSKITDLEEAHGYKPSEPAWFSNL